MPGRHPNANANQRARRGGRPRIDYYPNPDALTAIEARRTRYGPANNYSGILNAIIAEWLSLTGRKQQATAAANTKSIPEFSEKNAPARVTSVARHVEAPELCHPSRARARAHITSEPENRAEQVRVICGARRRSDGQPCQALSVQGKGRCRWHGGCSTGPRTERGRVRSLANLRQYRPASEDTASIHVLSMVDPEIFADCGIPRDAGQSKPLAIDRAQLGGNSSESLAASDGLCEIV